MSTARRRPAGEFHRQRERDDERGSQDPHVPSVWTSTGLFPSASQVVTLRCRRSLTMPVYTLWTPRSSPQGPNTWNLPTDLGFGDRDHLFGLEDTEDC